MTVRAQGPGGQATGTPPRRCTYVYGIVPGDVELTTEAQGVGDPPVPMELVCHGDIAALVSEIDLTMPLGRPDDLRAHKRLLDGTAAVCPVLPMRFGAIMADNPSVAAGLLAPHHDKFAAALRLLEGRAQYLVRGRYVEQAVLAEVLAENPQAARLQQAIRAQTDAAGSPEASRPRRVQLGQLVYDAITAKHVTDTRRLGEAVQPHCIATSVRERSHEQDAINVALLADTAREADLGRAVSELAAAWHGRVSLRLLGPMAAWDFAAAVPPVS